MQLELEQPEALLLVDVLTMHLEGMEEAKDRMIDDFTIEDIDTFNETLQIHQNNIQRLINIKANLIEGLINDNVCG